MTICVPAVYRKGSATDRLWGCCRFGTDVERDFFLGGKNILENGYFFFSMFITEFYVMSRGYISKNSGPMSKYV